MIPRVPPTSAVSPQPTRPLSVEILTRSEERMLDRATDGPIALGSLCSKAKVSTLVIVSELGFWLVSLAGAAMPVAAPKAANAPRELATPFFRTARRDRSEWCIVHLGESCQLSVVSQ